MSTPTPDRPQWSVTVTVPSDLPASLRDSLFGRVANAAHLWEPSTRDGWDVDVSAGPAASAPQGDTADVIARARCVLAESYDGIDPDVETRHDGAVANLAAAGLLASPVPEVVIERARHIIADHCFGPHATPAAEERALDIASACTDDMADQDLLAVAASPATPQARERGELWNVLDWSLWGNGMADTFRDPLADKMIAALTDAEYEQATALIERWRRLRGDQAYRKLYEDQRAEIERLKALSAPAPADDEAAIEPSETASDGASWVMPADVRNLYARVLAWKDEHGQVGVGIATWLTRDNITVAEARALAARLVAAADYSAAALAARKEGQKA